MNKFLGGSQLALIGFLYYYTLCILEGVTLLEKPRLKNSILYLCNEV